jgi:putative ABC transport system permease protein
VAPNIVQNYALQNEELEVYLPYRQRPAALMTVIARLRVPPGGVAAAFRREIHAIDPNMSMPTFWDLDRLLAVGYGYKRSVAVLFLIFAVIALLLASIGLYAVIAHSVNRRIREIGVRSAIGASARDILGLVFRQGMIPAGIGLAIGLAASLAVNRLLKTALVLTSPADPIALGAASAVLIAGAVLGCWIPARRAMRIDPAQAIRYE